MTLCVVTLMAGGGNVMTLCVVTLMVMRMS